MNSMDCFIKRGRITPEKKRTKIEPLPPQKAAYKLLYLALQNIQKKWTMPIHDWARALNQLAILFDGRLAIHISLTQNF